MLDLNPVFMLGTGAAGKAAPVVLRCGLRGLFLVFVFVFVNQRLRLSGSGGDGPMDCSNTSCSCWRGCDVSDGIGSAQGGVRSRARSDLHGQTSQIQSRRNRCSVCADLLMEQKVLNIQGCGGFGNQHQHSGVQGFVDQGGDNIISIQPQSPATSGRV